MRLPYLFLLLIVVLVSCQKDEPVTPDPKVLEDLHLTWAKDSVPVDILSHYKTVVFVNDSRVERRIRVEYSLDTISGVQQGTPYKFEQMKVIYSDSLVNHFLMEIEAASKYQSLTIHGEFLNISLSSIFANEPITQIYFIEGPIPSSKLFIPDIDIAGLSFHNVFRNKFVTVGGSYGEIFYTTAQGIVGFRGEHGEMWGLKGWE